MNDDKDMRERPDAPLGDGRDGGGQPAPAGEGGGEVEFLSRGLFGKDSPVSWGLLLLLGFGIYAIVMFIKSVLFFF